MSLSIELGLSEARQLLGAQKVQIIPEDQTPTSITREDYQSKTFRNAGFQYMTERYGQFDRTLFSLFYHDGRQVFIVEGKISARNPFEVMHAADGGMDMRKSIVTTYQYDGNNKITEIGPDGTPTEYTGEYGTPDALLPSLRQSLGLVVRIQEYLPNPGTQNT